LFAVVSNSFLKRRSYANLSAWNLWRFCLWKYG